MGGDFEDQFLFQLGEFVERSLELLRPEDRACSRVEQLGSDPQRFHPAPNIAFEDVSHPQTARHRLDIGDFAIAVPRDGAAGNDP